MQHLHRIAATAAILLATSSIILIVSGDEEGARAILDKYTLPKTKLNEIQSISVEGKCVCAVAGTLEFIDCGMENLDCLWFQVPVGTSGEVKIVSVGQKKVMEPTPDGNWVDVVEWKHASKAQLWLLLQSHADGKIIESSDTSKCIDLTNPDDGRIVLNDCSSQNAWQSWNVTEQPANIIGWETIVRNLLQMAPDLKQGKST